jgi:hypothetical protein
MAYTNTTARFITAAGNGDCLALALLHEICKEDLEAKEYLNAYNHALGENHTAVMEQVLHLGREKIDAHQFKVMLVDAVKAHNISRMRLIHTESQGKLNQLDYGQALFHAAQAQADNPSFVTEVHTLSAGNIAAIDYVRAAEQAYSLSNLAIMKKVIQLAPPEAFAAIEPYLPQRPRPTPPAPSQASWWQTGKRWLAKAHPNRLWHKLKTWWGTRAA